MLSLILLNLIVDGYIHLNGSGSQTGQILGNEKSIQPIIIANRPNLVTQDIILTRTRKTKPMPNGNLSFKILKRVFIIIYLVRLLNKIINYNIFEIFLVKSNIMCVIT